MLEEYDHLDRNSQSFTSDSQDLLQRLVNAVVDMETVGQVHNFIPNPYEGTATDYDPSANTPPIPVQISDDNCLGVVMTGYTSAYVQHAGVTAWRLIRAMNSQTPVQTPTAYGFDLTEGRFREGCERHLTVIRNSVDEMASDRFGMIMASPLLFLLDSAWLGYRALQNFCGFDIEAVTPWFVKIGSHVTGMGYRPLREPWLLTEMERRGDGSRERSFM